MEDTDMQEKFWSELCQIKFDLFYLGEYIDHSEKCDNLINLITAITSSGSIAAWALWGSLKFVWSSIIALSQVINAIKPHLPYIKRIKLLNSQCSELSKLFIEYDHLWLKVKNHDFTDEEINDHIKDIRIKKDKIDDKFMIHITLPKKNNITNRATINYNQYYSQL